MGKFKSPKCDRCGQTTQYLLGIDRGTVEILKAIAVKIKLKKINEVHPRNEMEVSPREHVDYRDMVTLGVMTSNQVGNLSRARYHGLIAHIEGKSGSYAITGKGEAFLAGAPIERYTIIEKAKKANVGYFNPENTPSSDKQHWAVITDFKPDQEYWEGMRFTINAGRVVPRTDAATLF